jgi:hypothetical protein
MRKHNVPQDHYGVLRQEQPETVLDEVAEQVKSLGYALLESGYTDDGMQDISMAFDSVRKRYIETHGEKKLRRLNEFHTMRLPLTQGDKAFLDLALHEKLLTVLGKLIPGKFVLNQQNGIVNPPCETYNQGAWHRDLPYQHFVSSRPLAVNALFCVDEFTPENGATFVLPASHKSEEFPSESYIRRNAVQVEAPRGSFLLLDCMLFHAGGYNETSRARRAVNHVYNIPYFKQQINIPSNMTGQELTAEARDILGFNCIEPGSVDEYLSTRDKGKH